MRRRGFVYVSIPVTLYRDPRIMRIPVKARCAAVGVFLAALCYSREAELDGFCPQCAIHMIGGEKMLEQLITVGLATRDERDGYHGIYLPDYVLWNETKAQRAARKRRQRERKPSPMLRAEVIERDGLICGICRGAVDPEDLHIDHLTPVSKGGLTVLYNLQVAHSRCNIAKGNRLQ